MKTLLEQIYRQRHEFLRRDLRPAVVLLPYEMRYQLLGEIADTYGFIDHKPDNRVSVMGMRVVFSHDVNHLEVLAGIE